MNQGGEPTENRIITLADICKVLGADVVYGDERLNEEVETACGCDLMSDVLAFTKAGSVLLTGLTNQQVVRTAEMLDLKAIIFVRNKQPDQETLLLAKSKDIPLLTSPYPLFESCGKLYSIGLKGCTDESGPAEMGRSASSDSEPGDPSKPPCGALWRGDS